MKSHALRRRSCAAAAGALMTLAGAAMAAAQFTVTQGGAIGGVQAGQPPPPMARGTGMIIGRAIEGGGTRPVAGAIVTLAVPAAAPLRVMADAQGQFAFRGLPAGRFTLSASRAGYVDGAYGRLRPGGQAQSIDLTADQHMGDVTITLWKFGAVTGRVTDENGDPIVSAMVRVLKRGTTAGSRQFVTGAADTTDDRGIYRISSLEPGEYLVVVPMTQAPSVDVMLRSLGIAAPAPPPGAGGGNATFIARVATGGGNDMVINSADAGTPYAGTSEDGHPLTYQTEFYPGAPAASRATPVIVASGEERSGLDFQLKAVRAVSVSGRLSLPSEQTIAGSISLVPADTEGVVAPIETATAVTDSSGAFTFTNVPPGQYVLRVLRTPRMPFSGETMEIQNGGGAVMRMVMANRGGGPGGAQPPLPTNPTLWAEMSLSVGSTDVDDIAVPLRPGLRVSGRVEFNGSAAPPPAEQWPGIALTLEPSDGGSEGLGGTVRGRIESTGLFTTMGVPPGRYLLRVNSPNGWTLRGALASGQDISDQPIELRDGDVGGVVIAFGDRPSEVGGIVTSASGQPDGTAAVILFPVDRNLWSGAGSAPRRLKNARAASDGSYSFPGLPAGDYFLAAVSDAAAADWQNVEFLTTLSRGAARITIGEGEKKTQALTVTRVQKE
jgi:uncharacterized protein (DUF2141 family)